VVGDDQHVAAELCAVAIGAVLEVIKQAFFVHQAPHKRQVRFLVLAGQRAYWIAIALGDVVAPGGHQRAAASPTLEHGIEDVEDGLVLEHAAVAADA